MPQQILFLMDRAHLLGPWAVLLCTTCGERLVAGRSGAERCGMLVQSYATCYATSAAPRRARAARDASLSPPTAV